jgi:hypothetical protein
MYNLQAKEINGRAVTCALKKRHFANLLVVQKLEAVSKTDTERQPLLVVACERVGHFCLQQLRRE